MYSSKATFSSAVDFLSADQDLLLIRNNLLKFSRLPSAPDLKWKPKPPNSNTPVKQQGFDSGSAPKTQYSLIKCPL